MNGRIQMTNYLAGIYIAANTVSVEERTLPTIGPKDVLLKNLRGGICGTDINIVKYGSEIGIRFEHEFGHELAGVVEEVRADITDIKRRYCLEVGGFSQYVLIEDAALDYNLFERYFFIMKEINATLYFHKSRFLVY